MARYRSVPCFVEAERNDTGQPIAVQTLHGEVMCAPGDWIVTGPKDSWPVEAEEFERKYERAETCPRCEKPATGVDAQLVAEGGACAACRADAPYRQAD